MKWEANIEAEAGKMNSQQEVTREPVSSQFLKDRCEENFWACDPKQSRAEEEYE